MVGCVEGILGMRPCLHGIQIAPAIPKEWEELEIDKDFRGKHLHILVRNPNHAECGCKMLTVDGTRMDGNYIPEVLLKEWSEIELLMS